GLDVDDLGMQRLALVVQMLDELLQAALRVEGFFLLLTSALVLERDDDALVEERELTETERERVEAIDEIGEDLRVRLEVDRRPRLVLLHLTKDLELRLRIAALEVHVVLFAVA